MFDPRIWLLAVGTFAIGVDAFVIAGILPVVATDLGVSVEASGQIVTVYSLAYGIGAPLMAALTARLPRARLVTGALVVFAATNLLCAIAPGYVGLLAARVAAGLAAAVYSPAAYALATAIAPPERRGAALSAVALGISLATVLGVPLGVVIGHALGWRVTFAAVALVSLSAAVALRLGRLPAAPPGPPIPLIARLEPLARPRVLIALAPLLLWSIAALAVYTYLGELLVGYGYGPDRVAQLFLVYGVGALIGSQLGGRLVDRFGPERPMLVLLGVTALNQLLFPAALGQMWSAGIVLFVWAFIGWAVWAPQQARLLALDPTAAAIVLSLANSMLYAGSGVGAVLGAALIPWIGLTHLPYAAAVIFVGAALSVLAGPRTPRPERARK